MVARILVVDDIPANVRLLEVRLRAEYFEVLTATNGAEAIKTCKRGKIDVVLLDAMMPEMDGFEACRQIKNDSATSHIPVVMITALDQVADRVRGLKAGADEFLTKPVNDLQLMTRVKNLVRLKTLTDELRLRASTSETLGIEKLQSLPLELDVVPRVLLVDEHISSSQRLRTLMSRYAEVDVLADPEIGFRQAVEVSYDCVVISTDFKYFDPLRLCSQLRSLDATRFLPIILVAEEGEESLIIRGLELGINDYVIRPVDEQELTARLRTQVRRKRYNDQLRANVTHTMELSMVDSLTGLHNRRYLDSYLKVMLDRAISEDRPLSVIFIDLDRLRNVNDAYGHGAGSDILRECGRRLRNVVRGVDLPCLYGGDEFVVIMPNTDQKTAAKIAERIRIAIDSPPFLVGEGSETVPMTVSVGVSTLNSSLDSTRTLMKRADDALYQAKAAGRNRVVVNSVD
ncbi:MAG: PleD family two-component system response regulator [Mesorhizobium sp.]|uniref:PleD family two-component system response regulator n=1 Tax=Mesorhizobium sp. TaxID=1871066 RepID=UPI001AD548E1|nr:PleD family two-component system response regulator [Mesorhizobium sp.]MBN9222059.1 PleD family two-component system response regulator [Mesorhizobium sp.]